MTEIMQDGNITVLHIGDLVRYARTGTVGEIVEITEEDGTMFAELNSTNLLYRLDTLTPISAAAPSNMKQDPDDQERRREIEEKIRKAAAELQDRTTELDSACAGAG